MKIADFLIKELLISDSFPKLFPQTMKIVSNAESIFNDVRNILDAKYLRKEIPLIENMNRFDCVKNDLLVFFKFKELLLSDELKASLKKSLLGAKMFERLDLEDLMEGGVIWAKPDIQNCRIYPNFSKKNVMRVADYLSALRFLLVKIFEMKEKKIPA